MIAVISDVHGNYPALKAVLKEIDGLPCDRILSLGDVSGYYCMINECLEELRERNAVNLLGNHDYYLLGFGKCPRSTTVNKCIDYQKGIIKPENLAYLKSFLTTYEEGILSARHGGWNDPIDEYIDVFDFEAVKHLNAQLFLSGHNHVQTRQHSGLLQYVNPGSVGQPRDRDCRAAFAVIDGTKVTLRRVEYDIDETAAAMKKAGFNEYVYENLYRGTKIGG